MTISSETTARVVPINMAEAIIEPFWDCNLSGLRDWRIDPETTVVNDNAPADAPWWEHQTATPYVYDGGYTVQPDTAHGLKVAQTWCWASFEWARKPPHGPALRMARDFEIPCGDYDALLASIMAPRQAVVTLTAVTDRGVVSQSYPPAAERKKEYLLDLRGATRLHTLTIEIEAGAEGQAAGWINWIGLQNTALLDRYLRQWQRFDQEWFPYLKPETYQPSFEPQYGFSGTRAELDALRQRFSPDTPETEWPDILRMPNDPGAAMPEQRIKEYVNFWTDTRYNRERDHDLNLIGTGVKAALAGVLRKDAALLRLGARYALSIAMCGHWDDSMICCLPGGLFEHKAFVQALCTQDVALILDLAWDVFTEAGRQFLLRRIAEEGIGHITWRVWKYAEKPEAIFSMNQLAWFSPGRVLGLLVLERSWPRVTAYADLAVRDLIESLQQLLLPDGGYVEGPSYFNCVAQNAALTLSYYARARGLDVSALMPDSLKRTSDFGEALASTLAEADVIPICDGGNTLSREALALLAALHPASYWTTLFRKAQARSGRAGDTPLSLRLAQTIPDSGPAARTFLVLPEMGVMASLRMLRGQSVKLLLMGNHAGAGHTHEDKGSFVLEFAGETFAMDSGSGPYADPLYSLLRTCQRHNMLVPVGMPERACPLNPLPYDVKPQGIGDSTQFQAQIDAAPGWERYYARWQRSWDSPSPETLIIRDAYELARGMGVEFYWHTLLPVTVDQQTITIQGERGKISITADVGCMIRVDDLLFPNHAVQHRIAMCRQGERGTLEVRARLSA